jgi:hypothetical protein
MLLTKVIILVIGALTTASPLDLAIPVNDAGDYVDRNNAEHNLVAGGCKYLLYSAVFATVREGYQCSFFKYEQSCKATMFGH